MGFFCLYIASYAENLSNRNGRFCFIEAILYVIDKIRIPLPLTKN